MNGQRRICDRCGEVIGAYEPVVLMVDGEPTETSLAAEPNLTAKAAERYHRDCYHVLTSPQTD